ncbi:MAG: hypothetical protein K2G45_09265 [Lachnospiraceae bacterium]|nr:hypothetical protein [Lachnospiraceae bacterium]
MEILFEIIKIILSTFMAGLITFLITIYNYNKSRPLDKLEIAYNRVYYPLYRLIKENNDMDSVINESRPYLDKYNKYVDRTTIRAFKTLVDSNTYAKKRTAYEKFEDNIYERNSYLRQRLGYLEPNFFQMYKYLPASQQLLFRFSLEVLVMAAFLILGISGIKILYDISVIVISIILVIFVIELVCCLGCAIWNWLRSVYYKIRKK